MSYTIRLKDKQGNILLPITRYRIGDLYLSTNSENPGVMFGGTWELYGPGRTLACIDTSQSEFNSIGKTGGAKTHTLTINEMPKHRHTMYNPNVGGNTIPSEVEYTTSISSNVGFERSLMRYSGNDQPHNNLQPFIVCYIWRKISN